MLSDYSFCNLPDEMQAHVVSFFKDTQQTLGRFAQASKACNQLALATSTPIDDAHVEQIFKTSELFFASPEVSTLIIEAVQAKDTRLIAKIFNYFVKYNKGPFLAPQTFREVHLYCARHKQYALANFISKLANHRFEQTRQLQIFTLDEALETASGIDGIHTPTSEQDFLTLCQFSLELKQRFIAKIHSEFDHYKTTITLPSCAGINLPGKVNNDKNFDNLYLYHAKMQAVILNSDPDAIVKLLHQVMAQYVLLQYKIKLSQRRGCYNRGQQTTHAFDEFLDKLLKRQITPGRICENTFVQSNNALATLSNRELSDKIKAACLLAYEQEIALSKAPETAPKPS